MKTALRVSAVLCLGILICGVRAQQPKPTTSTVATAAPTQIQKSIEAYLRNMYAFGPDVKLVVGPPKETAIDGLLETTIDLTIEDNKQTVKFWVSKDGKQLFRGEMSDLTKDPLAENRAMIQMTNAPAIGDAKAPVTIVEYSDFECPVCRSLHDALRGMLPNYAGKIRVVFKNFPLDQIHPWARTAAIAGQCANQQDPKAFWRMYDLIYDNQEIISAANAWTKMMDYGAQSGLNADALKSCMASPEATAAVNESYANGQKLEVNSTPTLFVNGRRLVGSDPHTLEQYINYELAQQKQGKPGEKK